MVTLEQEREVLLPGKEMRVASQVPAMLFLTMGAGSWIDQTIKIDQPIHP